MLFLLLFIWNWSLEELQWNWTYRSSRYGASTEGRRQCLTNKPSSPGWITHHHHTHSFTPKSLGTHAKPWHLAQLPWSRRISSQHVADSTEGRSHTLKWFVPSTPRLVSASSISASIWTHNQYQLIHHWTNVSRAICSCPVRDVVIPFLFALLSYLLTTFCGGECPDSGSRCKLFV